MNKYLMMSAAALLSGIFPAVEEARAHSGCAVVSSVGGGSFAVELNWKGPIYAARFGQGVGQGISGWTKGIGRLVDLSDSYYDRANPFSARNYAVSLPLRNGGAWYAYYASSGVSSMEINSGTYNVSACSGASTRKPASASVAANVAAVIAKRKGATH